MDIKCLSTVFLKVAYNKISIFNFTIFPEKIVEYYNHLDWTVSENNYNSCFQPVFSITREIQRQNKYSLPSSDCCVFNVSRLCYLSGTMFNNRKELHRIILLWQIQIQCIPQKSNSVTNQFIMFYKLLQMNAILLIISCL